MDDAPYTPLDLYVAASSGLADPDVIAAAGMAAAARASDALGLLLARVKYLRDGMEARERVILALALKLRRAERDRRVHLKGKAIATALKVLRWWTEDTCEACSGRGYEAVLGAHRLSGRACDECCGTGIAPEPNSEAGRYLVDVIRSTVGGANKGVRMHYKPHSDPARMFV